jgi:hypothetical protein
MSPSYSTIGSPGQEPPHEDELVNDGPVTIVLEV